MGNIDYDKLVLQLLPTKLRKARSIALLTAILAPLKALYTSFKVWQVQQKYDVKYQSGQVAHLERVLNDVFDATLNRIYIDQGNTPTALYVYMRLEAAPLYVSKRGMGVTYLRQRNGTLAVGYDFSVSVPASITLDEPHLVAVLNRYKRDSKTFKIIYI